MLANKRKKLYCIVLLFILVFLNFNLQTPPVDASSGGTTQFLGIDNRYNNWNVYFVYINTPKTFRVRFDLEDNWKEASTLGIPTLLIIAERPDGTTAERFNVPWERGISEEYEIEADQTGVWKVTVRFDPLLHLTGHFGCRYYIWFFDVNDQVWVTSLTSMGNSFYEFDLWLEVSEAKLVQLEFEGFHELRERNRGRITVSKPDGSIVFDGEPVVTQDPQDKYHQYMKVYTIADETDIGMWKIHIEEGYWGWYRILSDRDDPLKLFLQTETGESPIPPAGVATEWGRECWYLS